MAARDVLGARQVAGRVLVRLADVDDGNAVVQEPVDLRGVDLVDLLLDAADVLGSGHAHAQIT
jgi:hypothetical protein